MVEPQKFAFDAAAFLAKAGLGRKIVQLRPKQAFFSQGTPADCIFYLQKGRAKLTVVSNNGKEATITLLSVGDFVGEESLASVGGVRMATATAITPCTALSSSGLALDRSFSRLARVPVRTISRIAPLIDSPMPEYTVRSAPLRTSSSTLSPKTRIVFAARRYALTL
jgi:CRP-like cAMP-binding protein